MLGTSFRIAVLIFIASAGSAHGQTVTGPAEVVDGDTIRMTGTRIRLFGIDAPESNQTCNRVDGTWNCGAEATDVLNRMVGRQMVECVGRDTDDYDRLVATCSVNGLDVARAMVDAGMATALANYSDAYVEAEARAKKFKLGIWGSEFQSPAAWRAARRLRRAAAARRQKADRPLPQQFPGPRKCFGTSSAVPSRATEADAGNGYITCRGCPTMTSHDPRSYSVPRQLLKLRATAGHVHNRLGGTEVRS